MRLPRVALPFAVAAGLFLAILLLLIRRGLRQNAGTFVYPLDDAYIHLAVSRDLALHGVWGITPYSFSGASSSPAWTLLLASMTKLFGVHLLTPLFLNVAAALLLLLLILAVLTRALPYAGVIYLTIVTCAVVLIMPLSGIALIAMEHVLHSLASLVLAAAAALIVTEDDGHAKSVVTSRTAVATLMIAAFASGALRYDSCFLVCAVAVVLLFRKHFALAFGTCLASSIGPALYSLYSYRHSGIALPFSVVMKSAGTSPRDPLDALRSSDVSPLIVLLAVSLFLWPAYRMGNSESNQRPLWSYSFSFLIISLITTILHAELGPIHWLMRYESYLYALDLTALALAVGEGSRFFSRHMPRAQQLKACAMVVALCPLGLELLHRAHHGWSDIAFSIHDRYVEHLSQALFVEQQMPQAVVLANDIGFLAYYADQAGILDPLGLGSVEPVRLVRQHRSVTPTFIQQWAAHEKAQLAILHSDFPGMERVIPAGWILVESWCFPHNTVFLNHVESFYAPDLASAAYLRTRLALFHQVAPEIVRYRFARPGMNPPVPVRGEEARCPVIPSS